MTPLLHRICRFFGLLCIGFLIFPDIAHGQGKKCSRLAVGAEFCRQGSDWREATIKGGDGDTFVWNGKGIWSAIILTNVRFEEHPKTEARVWRQTLLSKYRKAESVTKLTDDVNSKRVTYSLEGSGGEGERDRYLIVSFLETSSQIVVVETGVPGKISLSQGKTIQSYRKVALSELREKHDGFVSGIRLLQ